MRQLRLKTILVVPLLAAIWCAILFQALHDRQQAIDAAETNTSNLARAFEEHVKKTVQNVDGLLLQLRDEYRRNPLELADNIKRLAQHKATAELLIQVSVINSHGFMVYNTIGMPPKPLDLSDREHFKIHLVQQGDLLFISKPVLGRASQKWSIQFTRKIFDTSGRFAGVMVLSIDPNYFSDYYKNIDIGPKGAITLTGMDGIIRARASKVATTLDPKGSSLPAGSVFFDPSKPSAGNFMSVSAVDGVERIGAYRRLSDYPLLVFVLQAKDDIRLKVKSRTTNIFIAGFLLSAAILITTWFFWRSEKRKTELNETLADNEELFRTLFDQFPIGTALVDKNCGITRINDEFSRISGFMNTELQLINIREIIKPEQDKPQDSYFPADSGISINQVEAICFNRQGQSIPILLTAAPVYFQNGELRFSILTLQDITGIKQVEADLVTNQLQLQELNIELEARVASEVTKNRQKDSLLLQQDKMASIGQLAAGVAHEINNPIGFVMSNLGALKKYIDSLTQFCTMLNDMIINQCSPEDMEIVAAAEKKLKIKYILKDINNLIEESTDGTERVRRIVLDLKDFARADEKGMKPADINECITSTINMVRNEIKYVADLDLHLEKLPLVTCSQNQINQVIANLLINAAHAIEKHGTITVTTKQDDDNVVLTISDTGTGMPKEVRDRIFEPFFTTKEVGKGTGLGLTICYDIIKKHNGSITVESEQGQGTRFIIVLPICGSNDFKI